MIKEHELLHSKNQNLNRFSNMMKILSDQLDAGNESGATLCAAIISRSGTFDFFDSDNKEKIYRFLNGVENGSVACSSNSALFARKCSLAAMKTIYGESYDLEFFSIVQMSHNGLVHGYEYKKCIKSSSTINGVRFRASMHGEKVFSVRSNIYYVTDIETNKVVENVYICESKGVVKNLSINRNELNELLKQSLNCKSIESNNAFFEDDTTLFLKCNINNFKYLLGVDKNEKRITHLKILT